MTAPKPGDRVLIRISAKVEDVRTGKVLVRPDWVFGWVDTLEVIKVLPAPVYVNSDTTEYRTGDVVKAAHDTMTVHVRTSCGTWIGSGTGRTYTDSDLAHIRDQLVLLVRNGKPVQP